MPGNNQKVNGALGLCMRAGKCVFGAEAAEKALKAGKARLGVVDMAASENTKKRLFALFDNKHIPWLMIPGAADAIGRPGRIVIIVTDAGFADMILNAYAVSEGTGSDFRGGVR